MKKPFATSNAWQQRVLELEKKLVKERHDANQREAELRGRIHELELLLASTEQRTRDDDLH